ncbi:hypothetical protein EHI8A_027680 [Entamoeba histolytica HM-1:IMSS-B]|uniref:Uncharacterized protein n=6 Tax=Entamoeba histolytica TaxID=5759 RepID=C4LZN1_ENTH1|nr:hypothetical protein EHI_175060 [Entamoeba histolytica HM-1:IMSS]EMD44126.1 Hypothetical protein EHI5A_043050 [Entamoeba histolytica KU27]EMH75000.1 hypothetical protein EHI8A_027680 [Entamoeba histolytica HM-1:IMSS-B]EMS17231.1 hypothetical protein KM1_052380 [Entamoeba histolytica HM-3:IMSS]ENY62134.1 hypothetical protein EHI7A_022470 [Entamoeba histolytica HM-1:IMSS-A]GAT94333.1 hypothetical protein CL6EHI_175060 [Entamoeba histolytica]|eukprot:XP_649895.1 hypothetical protein EHI_175060 [Entamoeba histolytica HM-1:IMSS]
MEQITEEAINQSIIEHDINKTIQLCEAYLKNIVVPGKQSKEVENVFIHYLHAMSNTGEYEKIKKMFDQLYSKISDASGNVAIMYINVLVLNDKIEDAATFSAHYLIEKKRINELSEEKEIVEKMINTLKGIKLDNTSNPQIVELVNQLITQILKEVEWENEIKTQLENVLNTDLVQEQKDDEETEEEEEEDLGKYLQVSQVTFLNIWTRKLWRSACSLLDYIKGIMRKPTCNEIVMIGVGAATVIGGIYALRKMKK